MRQHNPKIPPVPTMDQKKAAMEYQAPIQPILPGDSNLDHLTPRSRVAVIKVRQYEHEIERTWGAGGRILTFVSSIITAKFDIQQQNFNAAIASADEKAIVLHAGGMWRAWTAAQESAKQSGYKPLDVRVLQGADKQGAVITIVDDLDAPGAHDLTGEIWSVPEIIEIIERLPDSLRTIRYRHRGANDVCSDWDESVGDEIPF